MKIHGVMFSEHCSLAQSQGWEIPLFAVVIQLRRANLSIQPRLGAGCQCSALSSIKCNLCNGCLNLFTNTSFTSVIIACRLSIVLLGIAFPEETLAIPLFLTELLTWKCFQFC